jgi:hypothetical protein
MANVDQGGIDPQAVRSRARGRRFLIPLLGAWPAGILVGVVLASLGVVGMAGAVGTSLAVALGLDFVWAVIAFAIDDGAVDDRAMEAAAREEAEPSTPPAAVRDLTGSGRPAGR